MPQHGRTKPGVSQQLGVCILSSMGQWISQLAAWPLVTLRVPQPSARGFNCALARVVDHPFHAHDEAFEPVLQAQGLAPRVAALCS